MPQAVIPPSTPGIDPVSRGGACANSGHGEGPKVQWLSRPPPSTTRPSLRVEIWPEFPRLHSNETRRPASVTESVTIATARDATGRHPGLLSPL